MRSITNILVPFLLCLIWVHNAHAENFFKDRARGWFWFEEKAQPEVQDHQKAVAQQTPTDRIKNLQKRVEAALHKAVLEPTLENIAEYKDLQNEVMKKSEVFAHNWKLLQYTNPQYDTSLSIPINQRAIHISNNLNSVLDTKRINQLAKEYGLIFFYKGRCPYCQQYADFVQRFAKQHGFDVMAIRMDDKTLPQFPDARQDNGIASTLNVTSVPALIALHPGTKQYIPLGYGYVSEDEIFTRMNSLLGKKR